MATSGDCPGSEPQEGEAAVQHCEEAVHPEEFVAIADYSATDETQLSFLRGEKILILRQTTADWWWGERAGCCGYIPANHLGKHLEECDPEDTWQDEEYFGSYGTLKLHLEMLTDQPRTTKYHHVILQNRESLRGKVILDVGCGTGIISLFCAHHAQPKAVYAVEASEMAQHTGQLVVQNGFADIITVFQQKVEDVVLPEKVDVLVSEWMGTCLLISSNQGVFLEAQVQPHLEAGGLPVRAVHDTAAGHAHRADRGPGDDERRAVLRHQESRQPARVHGLVQRRLPQPGGGRAAAGAEHGAVPPHHPLEAGAVHDGRAGPRARGGRGHGLGRAAEEPCVEEAHVRHAELVGHFRAGPHVAESWRESLSDLEMTVAALLGCSVGDGSCGRERARPHPARARCPAAPRARALRAPQTRAPGPPSPLPLPVSVL
ncbi:protein arginine N-methyltransferase 2 isoform X3 [Rousettus aegyptiacus]|uniref:protein arginine N-methyltransferase 2 isoform X3 n=1 Tax=Rousettus aegyptiacus TaxID=9407 RepID=UPI00168D0842|nr:protein arginine N-methyltransferase 2 isoform X3 [Rousettus aegyptiacus]